MTAFVVPHVGDLESYDTALMVECYDCHIEFGRSKYSRENEAKLRILAKAHNDSFHGEGGEG